MVRSYRSLTSSRWTQLSTLRAPAHARMSSSVSRTAPRDSALIVPTSSARPMQADRKETRSHSPDAPRDLVPFAVQAHGESAQEAQPQQLRADQGEHLGDATVEEAQGACAGGAGRDPHAFGEFGEGEPPVALQFAEYQPVRRVRFRHIGPACRQVRILEVLEGDQRVHRVNALQ